MIARAVAVVLAVAGAPAAQVPTGVRAPRPTPNAIAVGDATLTLKGLKATIAPGAPLVVPPGSFGGGGPVRARTLGPAVVEGTIARRELGLRVQRDCALTRAGVVVGSLRRGAIVRVLGTDAAGTRVETLAPDVVSGLAPTDALAATPAEFVLPGEWSHETAREAVIYAGKDVAGEPRATLPPATHLLVVERVGEVARVRTHGPVELEGWVLAPAIRERLASSKDISPTTRKIPTHEVLVDARLYAGQRGGAPVGFLRGGALLQVERVATLEPKGRIRVRTIGDVRLEGWIAVADLRALEESVWRE